MSTLQYSVKKDGNTSVIAIGGSLDAQTAPSFDKKLAGEIEKGTAVLIINMQNLNYIASAGLGTLINANEVLSKQGGSLKLCCLNDKVTRIFKLLGFLELFTIYKTEDEAVK